MYLGLPYYKKDMADYGVELHAQSQFVILSVWFRAVPL